jgi:formylglycine-generating enzyme required for sulfatase activity
VCAGGFNKQGQWVTQHSGIDRSGTGTVGDPYVYGPKGSDSNWENKPVNYVSWYSSLRFINWLQNGQPVSEAGPGVTETGTYTFSDPSTVSIPDHSSLTNWHYALPTEDEWYKAAYYKSGGTAAGYWDYATQSDDLPNNNPPELDTGNSANYAFIDPDDPNVGGYAVGPPYYMTDVGAYSLSESAYGTYDQNGNLFEILEDIGPYGGPARGLRDSSWGHGQYSLPAYNRSGDIGPDMVGSQSGFRVGLVPEPGCVLALGGGSVLLLGRRKGNP